MGITVRSTTINQAEIKRVLRILSVLLLVIVLSVAALFYGIFTAESYVTVLLCIVLAVYILIPLSFRFCPHLQQSMVFQTNVDATGVDFEKPEDLKGVRNFLLSTQQGINIGLWHILPSSLSEDSHEKHPTYWEESIRLGNHKGIIIYYHGVTGTRGKSHRKELYKVLQSHEYHVISCDYRGFGDSTKVRRINETGVVVDALNVYKWVHTLLEGQDIPIFIWGHSLGTGISTHLMKKLQEGIDVAPKGLILESPFDNFGEELRHHAKLKIWSRLPFFDSLIVKPLLKNDIAFLSDGHISNIPVPIMIIHAKDDNVVPSHLGRRLFEVGKLLRQPQPLSPQAHPIFFVHMTAGKHNEIYKSNGDIFTQVVNSFTNSCLSYDFGWHKNLPAGLEIFSSNS